MTKHVHVHHTTAKEDLDDDKVVIDDDTVTVEPTEPKKETDVNVEVDVED